jgi:hypothetical protein
MCCKSHQCFKQNSDNKNVIPYFVARDIFIAQVGEKKVERKAEN